MSLAILTRAIVVTKFKVTEGSTESYWNAVACILTATSGSSNIRQFFKFIAHFGKYRGQFLHRSLVICISSPYSIGNGRTEGLPFANSRRKPVVVRYGDIGGRIFNPTPKPSIRKRLLINVRPRCIMVFRLFGKSCRCGVNQPCNMSGHTVPVIVNSVMESGV